MYLKAAWKYIVASLQVATNLKTAVFLSSPTTSNIRCMIFIIQLKPYEDVCRVSVDDIILLMLLMLYCD